MSDDSCSLREGCDSRPEDPSILPDTFLFNKVLLCRQEFEKYVKEAEKMTPPEEQTQKLSQATTVPDGSMKALFESPVSPFKFGPQIPDFTPRLHEVGTFDNQMDSEEEDMRFASTITPMRPSSRPSSIQLRAESEMNEDQRP